MNKILCFCGLLLVGSTQALAVDIYHADDLFEAENYQQAFIEYQKSAALGNPHAHYRLATLYNNGLVSALEPAMALHHLYIAAGYQYEDAAERLDEMLMHIPDDARAAVKGALFAEPIEEYEDRLRHTFYPLLKEGAGHKRRTKFHNMLRRNNKNLTLKLRDCEVEADGSWRNFITLVSFTRRGALNSSKYRDRRAPSHNHHRLSSCNQYMPLGHRDYPIKHDELRDTMMKNRKRDDAHALYTASMIIAMHPIFESEPNEGIDMLTKAADRHHPQAAYVLGNRHYFYPGRDLVKGLHYLTMAARFNYAPAEYRLGRILTDHPLIQTDEEKALFWFESAAKKELVPAIIKAAELRLFAEDVSLRSRQKALEWLKNVPTTDRTNPEYQYLMAMSHKNQPKPNWAQFFRGMERAIHNGTMAGWDVSEWQSMYNKYIGGNIAVQDNI